MIEKIVVDPAWHETQKSDAFIYDADGQITVFQRDGCDVVDTARWIADLYERYQPRSIEIDPAGPGAVIIQLLRENMGISRVGATPQPTRTRV